MIGGLVNAVLLGSGAYDRRPGGITRYATAGEIANTELTLNKSNNDRVEVTRHKLSFDAPTTKPTEKAFDWNADARNAYATPNQK